MHVWNRMHYSLTHPSSLKHPHIHTHPHTHTQAEGERDDALRQNAEYEKAIADLRQQLQDNAITLAAWEAAVQEHSGADGVILEQREEIGRIRVLLAAERNRARQLEVCAEGCGGCVEGVWRVCEVCGLSVMGLHVHGGVPLGLINIISHSPTASLSLWIPCQPTSSQDELAIARADLVVVRPPNVGQRVSNLINLPSNTSAASPPPLYVETSLFFLDQ